MLHDIKIKSEFADAVLCGDKSFEIRKNDRGYQKGDRIRFMVVGDIARYFSGSKVVETIYENPKHELNGKIFEITYVLSDWGLEPGYVALAIKPILEV